MTYHTVIQKALDEIEEKRQWVIEYQGLADLARRLVEKFIGTINTKNWRVSFGYEVGQLNGVLVHVDVSDMEALTTVRRWLRKHGLNSPKVDDYAELGRRSWKYKDDEGRYFILSGFFPVPYQENNSARCQFVQVGVEEKAVYELQCNGAAMTKEKKDA